MFRSAGFEGFSGARFDGQMNEQQFRTEPWRPYLFALVGAVILSWFLIYNGWPVFYEDSSAYLSRPGRVLGHAGIPNEWDPFDPSRADPTAARNFDRVDATVVWQGGRSVYYGTMMVLVSVIATSVGIAVLQAILATLAVAIPWFRVGGSWIGFAALVAVISAVTGWAVLAATLTPDIFMPIAILACATLVALRERLLVLDRWVLGLILGFCALSHNSILALLLAASLLAMLACALSPKMRAMMRTFIPIWASSVAGLAGLLVYSLTALSVTGKPPLELPHISARIATSEAGRATLQQNCPEAGFVVCDYLAQTREGNWIDFMFSRDPGKAVFATASIDTKYDLGKEQLSVLYLVLKERPGAVVAMELQDVVKQIGAFSLTDLDVSGKSQIASMVSTPTLEAIRSTASFRDDGMVLQTLSTFTVASTITGLLIIAAWVIRRGGMRRLDAVEQFCAWLLAGVFVNAAICAVLAGVYDRFQARVVWLVPLAAGFLIYHAFSGRQALLARSAQTSEAIDG